MTGTGPPARALQVSTGGPLPEQRSAYLSELRRADEGDAGSLAELMARADLDSLNTFVVRPGPLAEELGR